MKLLSNLPVIILTTTSGLATGFGAYLFARYFHVASGVPDWVVFVICLALSVTVQAFITRCWTGFGRNHSIAMFLAALLASGVSLTGSLAAFLYAFAHDEIRHDLWQDSVSGVAAVAVERADAYGSLSQQFDSLSVTAADLADMEANVESVCQNFEGTWSDTCGPRCQFLHRLSERTLADTSTARALRNRIQQLSGRLSSSDRSVIEGAYDAIVAVSTTPEFTALRQSLLTSRRELSNGFNHPPTGDRYVCELPELHDGFDGALGTMNTLLDLPPLPEEVELTIGDTASSSISSLVLLVTNPGALTNLERLALSISTIIELALIAVLLGRVGRERQLGQLRTPDDEFDASPRSLDAAEAERSSLMLEALSAFTLDGGRLGKFLAVPRNGDNAMQCREVCEQLIDRFRLKRFGKVPYRVSLHRVDVEFVAVNAVRTGNATQFELYRLPEQKVREWCRRVRRDLAAHRMVHSNR